MEKHHTVILGGGSAGLSLAYYLNKQNFPFTVYEKEPYIGGICRTHQKGPFLYDTGAHRFHNKIPEITREITALMGDDLTQITVPSKIVHQGKMVHFPLRPLDLVKALGPAEFLKAIYDVIYSRISFRHYRGDTFYDMAVHTYGKTLAEHFLLSYTEKLWGSSCDRLSPQVSGKRLKGLNIRTFLLESFFRSQTARHIDGSFFYPKKGFGQIIKKMTNQCGRSNIHTRSEVTSIFHDNKKVRFVEINGKSRIPADQFVSSLPLPSLVHMMNPPVPEKIRKLADDLHFRSLILVVLFLDLPAATPFGSLYFPDPDVMFTRISEPKNRSPEMAPENQTALMVEIPCTPLDTICQLKDSEIIENTLKQLQPVCFINDKQIMETRVHRIPRAYPILETTSIGKVNALMQYFKLFDNLIITGRNGLFSYIHFHDIMAMAKTMADRLSEFNK